MRDTIEDILTSTSSSQFSEADLRPSLRVIMRIFRNEDVRTICTERKQFVDLLLGMCEQKYLELLSEPEMTTRGLHLNLGVTQAGREVLDTYHSGMYG